MKKILLAIVLLGTALFGFDNVLAEEVNLDDIDTNTYIIGDRVYELNNYYLTIYDIVSATNEYAKNHNNEIAPIYYLAEEGDGEKYLLEILGSADSDGIIPTKVIEDVEDVYEDNVIDATAINNQGLDDFIGENVEPSIEEVVEKLNETAKDYGFKSITYKDKTLTFEIDDPERDLADYKDSGIVEYALALLQCAKQIEYKLATEKVEDLTVLNEKKVINLAKEVLTYLAGENGLTYGAVSGKSISAKITYVNQDLEYNETYKLEFKYDVDAVKDEVLENVAEELNTTAKDYGFESISYDKTKNVATFKISDLEALLEDYKDSSFISLVMANIEGATKVKYYVNNNSKEVDLTVINDAKVINLAMEILSGMAGKDTELTLGAVANKSATADVTYNVGGKEVVVKYELAFDYDIKEVKEDALKEVAADLNATAGDFGFESITYSEGVATFKVANPEAELAAYKDSAIVSLFMANIEGATNASYELNGETKTVDLTVINDAKVINLALAILSSLVEEGEPLTLGAVVGESVSIDVTYNVNGKTTTVTYTIAFE